ncbi:unnamed protein product [Symbiodinium sp. CCMP2592]|nr:unnamed protein product [Symbiodinium sp. CCMP2592]
MTDGLLLSVSSYAQDVLAFASMFLNKCGFLSAVPRSAPIGIAAQTFASVEERNEMMLQNSFLRERFTEEYENKLYKCGVRLAVFNQALRRSEVMTNTARMDAGFGHFITPLPADGLEMAALYGSKSLWATDQGYFYSIGLIPATVCASKKFVTETKMPFCEVIKGDLDETMEDFRFSKKREVTFAYLGDGDDFGLFLDGYTLERVILWKRVPLVMKFQRHLDAIGRPYTVTLCRCGKWGRQVDLAMKYSGTRNPDQLQAPRHPGSQAPRPSRVAAAMIPGTLRQWLDGWGSGFQSATEASIGATHARFGLGAAKLPQRLLVGTDCSGIDAPIHGLRELGITHQHLFGSEVAAGPRSVIEANTKPSVLFHSVLDADKAPFVHLYIAGFSCKPFSLLHNKSRLLKEKQAQIFYGVVARIQLVRPSCFVLENVSGIKRVSAKVLAALRSTGYHVEMILMNPAELQEPIQRPRYYFIGVRQDVSLISPKDMSCWLREAWAEVLDAVASGDAVDLLDRLLPASHPAVAQYQESRKRKWSQASNRGFPGSQAPGSHAPKWKELHKMCKASMQQGSRLKSESRRPCTESGVACCADTLFLHLPRERDAWDIICTKHAGSKELVADVSQNVNRARVRTDGSLPTVTPGAVLVSARAGRIISPLEKVMLHGFPIHRMVFPSKVTDKELASMGGNTMHVQIVAVAMKFALALVNWSLPKASRPTALCSTVAAPSITASVVLGAAAPKARKAASAQKPPKAPKAPKAQKAEGMSALAKRWQKVLRPQAAKKCSRKGATATLAISMPVGSRTLRGLAARFGLRSRKQDRTPTKKRRGPQGSVPAAPKKLRLESGEGLAQEGDDDTGGDWGIGCRFCAHLMNVLAQNPAERKRLGSRLSTKWGAYEARSRSAMQACCIHAHSKTFVHQVATKVYLAPDTPISQCLPYSIKHQHLFSGNVPQPADWLRAWRACRTASSFKGAVKFYSTEDFAAGRNTKLDSVSQDAAL